MKNALVEKPVTISEIRGLDSLRIERDELLKQKAGLETTLAALTAQVSTATAALAALEDQCTAARALKEKIHAEKDAALTQWEQEIRVWQDRLATDEANLLARETALQASTRATAEQQANIDDRLKAVIAREQDHAKQVAAFQRDQLDRTALEGQIARKEAIANDHLADAALRLEAAQAREATAITLEKDLKATEANLTIRADKLMHAEETLKVAGRELTDAKAAFATDHAAYREDLAALDAARLALTTERESQRHRENNLEYREAELLARTKEIERREKLLILKEQAHG